MTGSGSDSAWSTTMIFYQSREIDVDTLKSRINGLLIFDFLYIFNIFLCLLRPPKLLQFSTVFTIIGIRIMSLHQAVVLCYKAGDSKPFERCYVDLEIKQEEFKNLNAFKKRLIRNEGLGKRCSHHDFRAASMVLQENSD